MCIGKLDEIVSKYNNTSHRIIHTKTVDVNPSTYIDFNKEDNTEVPKFKVDNHMRISKNKNSFAKGFVLN